MDPHQDTKDRTGIKLGGYPGVRLYGRGRLVVHISWMLDIWPVTRYLKKKISGYTDSLVGVSPNTEFEIRLDTGFSDFPDFPVHP